LLIFSKEINKSSMGFLMLSIFLNKRNEEVKPHFFVMNLLNLINPPIFLLWLGDLSQVFQHCVLILQI
jgi:hypothetical protein